MICSHHGPRACRLSVTSNDRLGGEGQQHVRHPATSTEEPGRHHADDGERMRCKSGGADDIADAGRRCRQRRSTDDGDEAVRRRAAIVGGMIIRPRTA